MGVRGLACVAVLAAAAVLVGVTRASAPPPAQKAALAAVREAVRAGRLEPAEAARDRAEIARAARLVRLLPKARAQPIEVALAQAGALDGKLSTARALAVFGQLEANDDYFAVHWPPAPKTDVTGDDGLVYRWFPGRCLEFHPLAEFGALNARVAAGDVAGTEALADALAARAIHPKTGGVVWEYDFSFGGGRAPWTSGMAQAVAAQAFAGAASLVTQRTSAYRGMARAAFQAISPHLLTSVPAGPWIRLYSFTRMQVLNADLQSVLSLQSYATATSDPQAAALAARMERAAAASLGRFDTGYWSYYSLAGDSSPIDYQQYVARLLTRLGPQDARFAAAAVRFKAYLKQPPAFQVANGALGRVRFWLSKPAWVRISSGAGPTRAVSLGAGWHDAGWPEPKRAGIYGVTVRATDAAGNSASFQALPVVRVTSAQPKQKAASPARATAAAAAAPPSFVVGAGLDDPSQASLATRLGLHAVRITLPWPAGATAPDPATLASLQALPTSSGLVLELAADPLPLDDPSRAALASYAAALAVSLPSLRDLLLGPPPATPTDTSVYAGALAAVQTAVAAAAPGVAVGPELDGSATPAATASALASALAGAPVGVLGFRPAPAVASGVWTAADVPKLQQALGTHAPVLLEGVSATSPASYAGAVKAAVCSPSVAGVLVDRIEDGATADVPADGLFTADGSAKPGLKTFTDAAAAAQRGTAVCPGVAFPAAASTLTLPTSLSVSGSTSVQLGCVRDCLYLVTLDDAGGRPVVALRGSLQGGAAPQTLALPKATLKPGAYQVDVRLVSRVNPGDVTRTLSPPLSVG